MENLMSIARIIGEENEQKIKDGITNAILELVNRDLEGFGEYGYIVNFEKLFEEIEIEVEKRVKEKVVNMYTAKLEEKFAEWIKEK